MEAAGSYRGPLTRKRVCELLGVGRTNSYYKHAEKTDKATAERAEWEEARMKVIDEVNLEQPASGARKMARECRRRGLPTTRYQAGRLMEKMGVRASYPKPNTSAAAKHHKKFPYLLKNMEIDRPNQVWATDITYINLGPRSHMYLTAVIDWHSRMIVGWQLADTLETGPVLQAFDRAFSECGIPEVVNSDQGSTFTADAFVDMLAGKGIAQSMDGKARWVDNVIVERWFRTLKTECLRLSEYETPRELRRIIAGFVDTYNNKRLHQSLDYATPAECYYGVQPKAA